jgi:hypothetical protein
VELVEELQDMGLPVVIWEVCLLSSVLGLAYSHPLSWYSSPMCWLPILRSLHRQEAQRLVQHHLLLTAKLFAIEAYCCVLNLTVFSGRFTPARWNTFQILQT